MNKHIIRIVIGIIVLAGLTNISCLGEDEQYFDVLIKNETSNYLGVIVNEYLDNKLTPLEGPRFMECIEPSGTCQADVLDNSEIDLIIDRLGYQIVFIEAVNLEEINEAYILSRAYTNDVKITTRWYPLRDVQAMDWTIVYDGSQE